MPSGVTVTLSGQQITVKGPKGQLQHTAPDEISAFKRSRDSVGTASASARSSRQPCAVSAMVA